MTIIRILYLFFLPLGLFHHGIAQQNLIYDLLKQDSAVYIQKVINNPEKYKLEIHYTQIDRVKNKVNLTDYAFGSAHHYYHYPASLVKLPVSVMALEKLNMIGIKGVDKYARLYSPARFNGFGCDSCKQPSIAKNILYMLAVSDNNSFNRTYDFLGAEYIQYHLRELGMANTTIIRRFARSTLKESRTSGPIELRDTSGKRMLYREPVLRSSKVFLNPHPQPFIGKSHYQSGRITAPQSYDEFNLAPSGEIHGLLKKIIFPQHYKPYDHPYLTSDDYRFLRYCLGVFPYETGITWMNNESDFNNYSRKYILAGGGTHPLLPGIRMYNKVAMAYGFLADCAYIKDNQADIDYFLSIALYVNDNEMEADGDYEYRSIGLPFMARTGAILHSYEIGRRRAECVDLIDEDFKIQLQNDPIKK